MNLLSTYIERDKSAIVGRSRIDIVEGDIEPISYWQFVGQVAEQKTVQ